MTFNISCLFLFFFSLVLSFGLVYDRLSNDFSLEHLVQSNTHLFLFKRYNQDVYFYIEIKPVESSLLLINNKKRRRRQKK